jgi:photosystem II stability/assembly factor-like uncharacterized protein
MDDPRDDIDTWLSERVKPLLPNPGTFERIRKRARRRKLAQVGVAAGGAAVIVAAAVTVPHLVISQVNPADSTGQVTSGHGTTPPARTPSPAPSPSPSGSSPSPRATAPALPQVPANFAPSSVTFVSTGVGWVLGQAGTPGHCTGPNPDICTSLAVTSNGGATWQGMPAPVAGSPDSAHGVSEVRSLNGADAWAFGPQLYATHNGGQTWTRVDTHGMRVTDLETVNGHAFAVWARCTGTGPDFAAGCTSFSLYSTQAGADQWSPVPGVTGLGSSGIANGTQGASSAQLVLTGTRGYLLAPNGDVYSGPVTSTAGWQPALGRGSLETACLPGPAQANGVPANSMLAATGAGLVELCQAQPQGGLLMYSADGGHTWQRDGYAPASGTATSLSGTPTGQVLIANTSGIDVSANIAGQRRDALRWRSVHGATVPGGFSYVGMTTSEQGVAVPADVSLHALWFTYDGGQHWQESIVH